jgi:hypothetical protein
MLWEAIYSKSQHNDSTRLEVRTARDTPREWHNDAALSHRFYRPLGK